MGDKIETARGLAFTRCADALYPFGEEKYGSRNKFLLKTARTGAFLTGSGGIRFCIYAPEAHHVYVSCEGLTIHLGDRVNILDLEATGDDFPEYRLELVKSGEGFFQGELPAAELTGFYGPFPFTFVVDGAAMVHPYCRTTWRSGRLMNCVEVPDPDLEEKFSLRDVPHGAITYEIFWSRARNNWSPCLVYTPPGYGEGEGRWPVLYLQHGGGENETDWFTLGNLPEVMDNLIADGLAVPFVVVMNNTHLPPYQACGGEDDPGMLMYQAVDDLITKDCIPFIEQKYRVRTDKWGRAIAGLSMGAMQSSYVGFTHPEIFGNIGLFSGSIRCRRYWTEYDKNPHLNILREGKERLTEEYRVFYRGVAEQEHESRPWHKEDDRWLHEAGLDTADCYHYTLHPTMCHEWGCFRRSLYDFAQLIFQQG